MPRKPSRYMEDRASGLRVRGMSYGRQACLPCGQPIGLSNDLRALPHGFIVDSHQTRIGQQLLKLPPEQEAGVSYGQSSQVSAYMRGLPQIPDMGFYACFNGSNMLKLPPD